MGEEEASGLLFLTPHSARSTPGTQFHHTKVLLMNKNQSMKSASSMELKDEGKTTIQEAEKAKSPSHCCRFRGLTRGLPSQNKRRDG